MQKLTTDRRVGKTVKKPHNVRKLEAFSSTRSVVNAGNNYVFVTELNN